MRISLLLCGTCLCSGCRQRHAPGQSPTPAVSDAAPSVRIIYPSVPGNFVKLARKASRALVHLYTDRAVINGPADWFPDPRQPNPGAARWTARRQTALGSGFVIDQQGHVLTNAHIVGQGRKVWAKLSNGTKQLAKVVGMDKGTDLALLKIAVPSGQEVYALRPGDTQALQVGQWVLALSDPFGLGYRASAGVISALPHSDAPQPGGYWRFIQTDIAIHAGSSGGPLLNLAGEVVGLSTAPRSDASGVGLALPFRTIAKLLPSLKRSGKVVRSWVGIYIGEVTDAVARRLALKPPRGALITGLEQGPGLAAGLRKGDVVLSFDGKPIKSAQELPGLAQAAGVGRPVPLEIWRDGKTLRLSLHTQPMPE